MNTKYKLLKCILHLLFAIYWLKQGRPDGYYVDNANREMQKAIDLI